MFDTKEQMINNKKRENLQAVSVVVKHEILLV